MDRAAVAWRVGLAHLVLALGLQLENAAQLLTTPGGWAEGGAAATTTGAGAVAAGVRLFAEVPFLQLQNLAVAAVLALVAWATAGRRWLRPLPHLLLAFVNALLIGDQLAYKVFLTHIELTPGDTPLSSLAALRSSAWAAVGTESTLNLLALLGLSIWAWRGRAAPPAWLRSWRALWLAPWLLATVLLSLVADAGHLQDHPVCNLLAGLARPVDAAAAADDAGPRVPLADLYLPRSPVAPPAPGEEARLRQALARLRRLPHPNVLLVVLESVGAKQLFAGDRLAPRLMPRLAARLAAGGVAFADLYAPFPGTTRSHVALETGGGDIAGGDFASEIRAAFVAPTAAHAFARLGYRTAVFSAGDLGPQDLGELLVRQGYDTVFDPQQQPAAWRDDHEVSSWGVDEEVVGDRLTTWLAADRRRPWFAELLTVSTHHPYAAPGVPASLGDEQRYQATLGFTDDALDSLLRQLAVDGQLERTLVLVTGDHGEAFATWHALNFTHRNYLYEENVRSFLLVLSPALAGLGGGDGPASARVATMGDVLPTVLAALGERAPGVPGQSLWPDAYSPRIVFFSKNTQPAQWGLRDGSFKFIARVEGDKGLELYDLAADPNERTNLAAAQPDRAMLYDRLCARWFASATADYKARLAPGKDRR